MEISKLNFIKINPAGNVTILIKNPENKINKNLFAKISQKIIDDKNLFAEQVGFIDKNSLTMMGGEFCGNASRAFASFLAFCDKTFSKQKKYEITCSGYDGKLTIDVRETKYKNQFLAKIKMPNYLDIKEIFLEDKNNKKIKLVRVDFEGIIHFICLEKANNEIIDMIKIYLSEENYSAFGVMFLDERKKDFFMTPFVYVKNISGVWENSCASGTTALGIFLKKYRNLKKAKVNQPGGWLEVSIENEEIFIDGPVEIVAQGECY